MRTALIDYDSGNLHSAHKAFALMAAQAGAGDVIVTSDPHEVAHADRIVLPGDGAFPACRAALVESLTEDEETVAALMEIVDATFGR